MIEITDEETDLAGSVPGRKLHGTGAFSCLIQNQSYFGKNVWEWRTGSFYRRIRTGEGEFSSYEEADMREYLCRGKVDPGSAEVMKTAVSDMSFGFIDYVLEHPEILREE